MGKRVVFLALLCCLSATTAKLTKAEEDDLKSFILGDYNTKASEQCYLLNEASWTYATNITDANSEAVIKATEVAAEFDKKMREEHFKDISLEDVQDAELKRLLKDLVPPGRSGLSPEKLSKLTKTISSMEGIYSSAKICPYEKRDNCAEGEKLNLDPGIEAVISNPNNSYEELEYVWTQWHEQSGKKMRAQYVTYVELSNEVGALNNFSDYGALWRDSFETENFVEQIDALWDQVEPLYAALHKYTSKKLKERFGARLDVADGLLPAHVFGNMWAQSWVNLEKILVPYPEESEVDVNRALKQKYKKVRDIFVESDKFYKSLGLPGNEMSYGEKAMIERPEGRDVVCHASAWDFCKDSDFRIKMCTGINQEDFVTVHHEMGHIQYYIQYKHQPLVFRDGANPGFHEAVGDTIALSVQSVPHLKTIGLIADGYNNTERAAINTLMNMALDKIAFLPFGLLIDKWRWDVFENPEKVKMNEHWWELRQKYQRIKPPSGPRDETYFDPGAKYHVAADSQYISYFVSHILQFQFYKAMCIAAGKYNPDTKEVPLHECDFYQNEEAGKVLSRGLSAGSSKPWPEVLKDMTGTSQLDASALVEYFAPLIKFLDEENGAASGSLAAPSLVVVALGVVAHLLGCV